MRLVRVYPHISPDQEVVFRRADYGGLLDIKCSKLFPELCKFLMESFDPVSCKLVFPGRGAIPVTEPSVQEVLGLPRGNRDVRYEIDVEAIAFMSKEFGKTGSKQPLLTSLETKLVAMKKADSRFLRLFIAYGLSAVVAPTTGRHISPRLYPSLVNIKEASKLNICKFVITMLCEAAGSKTDKAILKSCMLYFMVIIHALHQKHFIFCILSPPPHTNVALFLHLDFLLISSFFSALRLNMLIH